MDSKCPTYKLYDALVARGWVAVKALCDHSDATISEFDGRVATRMRPYYQALLGIKDTIKLTSHMPSQEPMHYYNLLLMGKEAEPGQPAQEYLVAVNACRKRKGKMAVSIPLEDVPPNAEPAGEEVILALEPPPEAPRRSGGEGPKRRRLTDARTLGDPGGDGPDSGGASSSGGGVVHPIVGEPEPIITGPPEEEDEPVEEELVVLGSAGDEPEERTEARDPFQPAIGGAKILYQWYVNKKSGKAYGNFILKCPRHDNCYKKRLVTRDSTARYGDMECVAYLHAWVPRDPPDEDKSHANRACNPSNAEVDAIVVAHRDELEEICWRAMHSHVHTM